MEQLENMNETMRGVHDTLALSIEGLTTAEIAESMRRPSNTIDCYLQRLLAHGNVVKTGTCRVRKRGRLAFVYATKKNEATSKVWVQAQKIEVVKLVKIPLKAEKETAATQPKAVKATKKKATKPKTVVQPKVATQAAKTAHLEGLSSRIAELQLEIASLSKTL